MPGVVLVGEVLGADGVAHQDPARQVGNAGPSADLVDGRVGGPLDRRRAGAIGSAVAQAGICRDRNQHEEVLVALGGDGVVGLAGLAQVDRRRVGDVGCVTEDRGEVGVPVTGEEQRVVRQLGQPAADPEHHQDSSRAAHPATPPSFRIAAGVRGQQPGLGVVQVGRRDDDLGLGVPVAAVGRSPGDAGHSAGAGTSQEAAERMGTAGTRGRRSPGVSRIGGDLRHPCAGGDPHPFGPRQILDAADQLPESADRVLDPLGQVEGAHQVVHRRCPVGAGAQEDRGVAQHLPQHGVAEPA